MQTVVIRTLVVCVFLFGLSLPGSGRGMGNVTVMLPFDAKVGQTVLPSGEYTIRQVQHTSDVPLLSIASASGGVHILVMVNRIGSNGDVNGVVLAKEGGGYRLTKIHVAGLPYSYEIVNSGAASR